MNRRLIITRATAATVVGWATQGTKRLRAKYRHAVTACRVLNRRESPLVGVDANGKFGPIANIKFSWGFGPIGRDIGWYGDWHVKHGRLPLALHSRADLRTWARRGYPTTRPWFFTLAGDLCNTDSRRRLLGKSRPC